MIAKTDMQYATSKQHSSALQQSMTLLEKGCQTEMEGEDKRYICPKHIKNRIHENLEKSAHFLGQNGL